jgi:hypothetical protein
MALGSTQPLTEMSARNLPGGKRRPASKADNLTAMWEPIVHKMWEPRRLTALRSSTSSYKDSFTLLYSFVDLHGSCGCSCVNVRSEWIGESWIESAGRLLNE